MKFTVAVMLAFTAAVCLCLLGVDARVIKRSAEVTLCSESTPCGWEVYQPATRISDFFVNSPCQCPGSTRCLRHSDDISIAAYVYRCKPNSEEGYSWND